jgi:hypothetical protein
MRKLLLSCCTALALALAAAPALAVVTGTTTEVSYTGNGATTAYPFSFKATDKAWVKVVLGGVAQASGFTVTLNTNQDTAPGGTVTFASAPASGAGVTLRRVIPIEQRLVYRDGDRFPAKTTERGLDLAVMLSQQVDRRAADAEAAHAADKAAWQAGDATLQASLASEATVRAAADGSAAMDRAAIRSEFAAGDAGDRAHASSLVSSEASMRSTEDAAIRAQVAGAALGGGVNIADNSTVLATGAPATRTLADHLGGLAIDRARGGAQETVRRLDLTKAVATRAAAPLATPVPYFGDEMVHPDVYFNAAGWHGFRYWMAATPYESSNSQYENPSVYVSNDGQTWSTPPGLTNPIVAKPAYGYNSDTDLVDGLDGRLYLFYRVVDNVNGGVELWVTSSSDGAAWSAPVKILEPDAATDMPASQAVVFTGSEWSMYYVDVKTGALNTVRRRTAASPVGPWSAPVTMTIDAAPAGQEYWHLDAKNYGGQTILLLVTTTEGSDGGGLANLFFAWSDNGNTFTRGTNAIIPKPTVAAWDSTLYRASFVPVSDGGETKLDIWYSANGTSGWRIGYSTASLGRRSVADIRDAYATETNLAAVQRACNGLVPVRFCDVFNRADSATVLGGGWSVVTGVMGISGRQLYQPTSVNSRAVVDAGTADFHVLSQFRALGAVPDVWMIARYQDTSNYLRFGVDAGTYKLQKIVAGVATNLWIGSTLPPAQAGDWTEIVTSGTSVTALINGVQAASVTEATFQTATKVGVQAGNSAVRIGNFAAWSESVNADQDRYLGRVSSQEWSAARACLGVGAGVACDTFLRPDATAGLGVSRTGHAWVSGTGVMGILNRQAYSPAGTGVKAAVETGVADSQVGMRVAVVGTEQFLMARYSDTNNFFRFGGSTTYQVQRIDGGAATTLASGLGAPAAGDWLELVLSADSIKAYVNGTLVWSGTDAFNQTATKAGLQLTGATTRIGAFYATSDTAFPVASAPTGVVTSTTAPACNDSTRGVVWVTRGAAGVKDSVQVCAKDAADAYGWRALY